MDYKLKNRDGVETTYAKDKIKIPAATGDSMVVFTQGEAQAEKTVDIAENGAFTVEPDEGFAFVKKVSGTVNVPTPVTSVNGQTGDVKTGMVVNFTLDTTQSQDITSDVPFADVISFINESTEAKPYIQFSFDNEGDVWAFDQYSYNSDNQVIFIYGGYLIGYTSFGLSFVLIWSTDGIKSADVSSATPVVLDLNSSDNSVSIRFPNGFIAEAFGGIISILEMTVNANIPAMVVIDGATEAMYSGTSNIGGMTVLFTSPYIDGVRKVVKGTVDINTQSINWTVEDESIVPKVHIVHADIHIGGESTADANFQKIKGWIDNNEVVLLQSNNYIVPINTNKTDSSKVTFELSIMMPTGFVLSDIVVNSDNTWSAELVDCTTGFQYESQSGKKFTIKVADDGTLSTEEVTT